MYVWVNCSTCKGEGIVRSNYGGMICVETCWSCNGDGGHSYEDYDD